MNQRHIHFAALAAAVCAITGCAGMKTNPGLESARASLDAAERDPDVADAAAVELERAREALARAEATFSEEGNSEPELLMHQVYLTERLTELAETEARTAALNERIEGAEVERTQVLLEARTREAEEAERLAERQSQAAETALSQAEQAEARAASAEARAQVAAGAAVTTAREAEILRERIDELEMQETERGLVLTLGDVLFDVDAAEIKPGAAATLGRLAAFLQEYEERVVLIEGHTDSTGASDYNESLSERRANAVRAELTSRGIAASRIETAGLGESAPVANNDTAAGRQQNRRVEVIISEEGSVI